MPNLSQKKRQRMLEFLSKIKEEHKSDDEMLIALGEIENELVTKKYGLVWEEHEENVDVQMRTNIPVFTEVKEREITAAPDEGYNFILEGDNLHSLYLLEKTHKGKIDLIYIDPPYNTGNKDDFKYDDRYVEKTDAFIHSKWLSFMDRRLSIASELLKESGLIFISIGEQEYGDLRLLCDDVFDESNYITTISRISKTASDKGNQFAPSCDFVLCYAKDKTKIDATNFYDDVDEELYTKTDADGRKYRDDVAFYQSSLDPLRGCVNQRYFVQCPDGTFVIPPGNIFPSIKADGERIAPQSEEDKVWRWSYDTYLEKKHLLVFKKTKTSPLLDENGNQAKYNVYTISYLDERKKKGVKPRNFLTDKKFLNRRGQDYIKKMEIDFPYSKPKELIEHLFYVSHIPQDAIVLDFFAGSGTTGEAVLDANQLDGGKRSFILCTNNENDICDDVTYPRMKTVISGFTMSGKKFSDGLPANLKYYRTDFIPRDDEELSERLNEHIVEMIQLEHGVDIDGKEYIMVLTDAEMDDLEQHWSDYPNAKALYISQNVMMTTEQARRFAGVEIHIIPDYYFKFELKEIGEIW